MRANLVKRSTLFLIGICFAYLITFSQKSAQDYNNTAYNKAMELFEREKYVAAQKYFNDAISDKNNQNSVIKSNSQYYSLICAIELFNEDAEFLGNKFIAENPESPFKNNCNYRLGNFEYTKKKYKQTLEYYGKINKNALTDDDRAECYFKTGYSWFMLDSLDKARQAFYAIKDIDSKYNSPAIYYYAHIAYVQKNYETAIANFTRLKDDETFSSLVPYYISQCYYFQEKFDDLLAYAPPLIDSVVETRVAEMAKMIGDAYYHKNQLKEAIPYYERYFGKGKDFKPEDFYQAGYCYYSEKDYEKAVVQFEKASTANSALAQNANYHLGDCYIRLGQKDKALLAFANASKLDFDAKVKEDAAFNYAELSYEKSNPPFNSSIKALNDYISQYPNSRRSDEAYTYLIAACLNTHNYQDALTYLGKIKNKDRNVKKAYQRAAIFRGLELFNNLQFSEALKMFDLSQKYSDLDEIIATRTFYWIGEVNYRLQLTDDALDNYEHFQSSESAKKCQEYKLVNYNIAYCCFNKKEYGKASLNFSKFIDVSKGKKDKLIADANNRLGDCSFIESKYDDAIGFYTKSIESGLSDKDYAMYQKGFTLGLKGDHKKKISLLNQLLTSMPESKYCDDAIYEIGHSEVILQKTDEATKYFKKLLTDYPSSSYAKKALLQLGLIDFNAGNNQSAIETYKKVIANYPGTQEARSALGGIKNIYVQMNQVDAYLKYTETLGDFANVSLAEQDSLLYISGENFYTAGDCGKATENLTKYITKFPKGNFVLNAYYYKGDCGLKSGNADSALLSFNYVISKPWNNFSELALAASAKLKMDKKDYLGALANYTTLDSLAEIEQNVINARVGKMQALYNLNNYKDAITASEKVLKTSGIAQEIERHARYVQAKSLLATDGKQKAFDVLKKLSADVKNSEGAEAEYLVTKDYFDNNQADKSQKEIFRFIDLNSPHQYWVAKAFILLAEIYHNKKDNYQAINTLKSIINNYDNKDDGIVSEAREKETVYESKNQAENTHAGKTDNDSIK